jgi:type III restriction enzyme
VLYRVEWSDIDVTPLAERLSATTRVRATEVRRVGLEIISETTAGLPAVQVGDPVEFDPVYATRAIFDIVPNAWVGREIVGDLLALLKKNGWTGEQIGSSGSFLIEELRRHLQAEVERLAEQVFRGLVHKGEIQFRLRTDAKDWELPMKERIPLPASPRFLARPDGRPVAKSLLEPVYAHELNGLELDVACYLDSEATLKWWYRNLVTASSYYLQGWRKNKVYPDIVFAMESTDSGGRMVVLETKGNQLSGNQDTMYKGALMKLLTEAFSFEQAQKIGTLEVQLEPDVVVSCDLVYESNWRTDLQGNYFS